MNNLKKITRKLGLKIVYGVLIIIILILAILSLNKPKTEEKNTNIVESKISATSVPKKVPEAVPTTQPITEEKSYNTKKEVVYKKGKLLSKHTITNWGSSDDRNINMKVASEIINTKQNNKKYKGKGYLLMTGETFSWLEVVGQTTREKGFKVEGILVNGQHQEALGGGVCQVASTINSAAIKAGLNTKALKHYKTSPGYLSENDYEATVTYDGGKDLKVTNTLDYPVLIKVIAEGKSVTVKIFRINKKVKYIEY